MESPLIITVVLLGFSIIIAQNENQKSSKNFWISVFFWVLTILRLHVNHSDFYVKNLYIVDIRSRDKSVQKAKTKMHGESNSKKRNKNKIRISAIRHKNGNVKGVLCCVLSVRDVESRSRALVEDLGTPVTVGLLRMQSAAEGEAKGPRPPADKRLTSP